VSIVRRSGQPALAYREANLAQDAPEAGGARDRRQAEFLAQLGHDLRNPLAPIRTAVQLLRMPGIEPERAKALLDLTERQVMHMAHLIDQLMDLGELDLGRVALKLEPVDLSTIIDEAVGQSSEAIGAAGHQLELQLPDSPLPLHADRARLAQAIACVIDNAARFTDPGGRIEVEAAAHGNVAVLNVSDNGYGIAAADLATLFSPFTRGARKSSHAASGLGNGLALARSLIETHHGSIEAHSAGENMGSNFRMRIPLAQG
jgi:signal transduction histidine kinase